MNYEHSRQLGLRFRFNAVFLPEYLSTVLISFPVSALFLTNPQLGGQPNLAGNPHWPVALGLYVLLALALVIQTFYYRFVLYRPVQFHPQNDGTVSLSASTRSFDIDDIDSARETLGRMFGRTVRQVELSDGRGWPIAVSEALHHYDQFKVTLASLIRGNIQPDPELTERLGLRTTNAWIERHELFPPMTTAAQIVTRFLWRLVCLLPVAFMDLLINTISILALSGLHQREWMVYSAPLSLLLSGAVARYVYFYLFTSTVLNRPLES